MEPFHTDSPENVQGVVIAKRETILSGPSFAMLSEGSTEGISRYIALMLRCTNKVSFIQEQQRKLLLSVSGKPAPRTGRYTELA